VSSVNLCLKEVSLWFGRSQKSVLSQGIARRNGFSGQCSENQEKWIECTALLLEAYCLGRMIVLVAKARRTSEETAEPAASRGILLSSFLSSFLTCSAGLSGREQ